LVKLKILGTTYSGSTTVSNEDYLVKPRATYAKKKAYNFERQKKLADLYISSGYGIDFDKKRQKNIKTNYDLLNARVDLNSYKTHSKHSFLGEKFELNDTSDLIHYPLIAQICQSMIGEELRRPHVLSVEDLSPFKETFEAKEYNRLLKQDIETNFLLPLREKVSQNLFSELGIENESILNPEQQQEFAQQVDAKVKALSPNDIIEYMENDYRTPVAKQGQEVINFLDKHLNLKEHKVEGFVHMLPTGEEYYHVDTHRDQLVFENVPPDELRYGGSPGKVWVQEMDWAVRTRWMTLPHITEKYSEYLTPTQIKEIESCIGPIDSGPSKGQYTVKKWQEKTTVKNFQRDVAENREIYESKFNNLDTRTKEGHRNAMKIYNGVVENGGFSGNISNYGLKVEHVVWKDDRTMKKVERWNEEQNRMDTLWFDEHYETIESDIKVTKVWIKEVWEATRIGGEHYVKVQPVRYSWSGSNDPYGVELPYVGKKYFSYKNRTRNRSVIDAGKSFQRDFDVQMSRLKHSLKTNLGKLFIMNFDRKPDKMSIKEWFTTMKDFSTIAVQSKKHGASALDDNLFKGVDASKMSEIVENINLLEFFKNGLFTAMYFSEARAGAAGQYTNTTNLQSQQNASYNQTEYVYDTHRIIFEKAANKLLNISRLHYKDHPEQIEHILSPVSLQELKAGREFFYTEMGVRLESTGFALQQIEFLKQQMMQLMAGAGGNGIELVMELSLAQGESEIINIVKTFSKKVSKAQAEAQQFEQAENERRAQVQLQVEQQKLQNEYKMHQEKLENSRQLALLNREIFKLAGDIDDNKIPDSVQIKELDNEFKREKLIEDTKVEYAKIASGKTR